MLGVPTPNEADPTGENYAFEKGAEKVGGGEGFADVWKRGHFAWEYKGKRKDLKAAYQQLLQYREALENPPLLVVCDLDRFEVHTNFTATPVVVHAFALRDLLDKPEEPLLASTASPWQRLRSTGWPGSLASWPRSCGSGGTGRCRPGGCSSPSRAAPSSVRYGQVQALFDHGRLVAATLASRPGPASAAAPRRGAASTTPTPAGRSRRWVRRWGGTVA